MVSYLPHIYEPLELNQNDRTHLRKSFLLEIAVEPQFLFESIYCKYFLVLISQQDILSRIRLCSSQNISQDFHTAETLPFHRHS